jgi:hypothetical protein
LKKYFNQIYFNNSKINQHNIIAILLITIGVFLLYIPISNIEKIGVVLIIIGFFLIVLKTDKTANDTKELPIMLIMIIWIIVVYIIIVMTSSVIDILLFLVLIGLLVINEFTSKVISLRQKNRMHFVIFIFVMIIIIILIKKIISMSNM